MVCAWCNKTKGLVVHLLARSGADRLLVGSPLRRPRVAAAIIFVLLVVIMLGVLSNLVLLVGFGLFGGALQVFVLALVLSLLLSLVPLSILRFLDRRERESRWLFAAAFLWGGVIATGLALPANQGILFGIQSYLAAHPALREFLGDNAALLLAAPLAGPLVEETTKGLGVLLLFWLLRAEFDNLRDGMIYGALVGVGFNWLEVALYIANGYAETGVAPWGAQLGARYSLLGLGGHALFSGLFGASLGLARQTAKRWVRVVAPIVGFLLALFAHMFNNALPLLAIVVIRLSNEPIPATSTEAPVQQPFLDAWLSASLFNLVLFLPMLVLLWLAVWRSGVWERRVIRSQLADEDFEIVAPSEQAQIAHDRILATRRIDGLSRRRSRALVNAQNELAFRKWRVQRDSGDPASDQLVRGWREEIRRLREQPHPTEPSHVVE